MGELLNGLARIGYLGVIMFISMHFTTSGMKCNRSYDDEQPQAEQIEQTRDVNSVDKGQSKGGDTPKVDIAATFPTVPEPGETGLSGWVIFLICSVGVGIILTFVLKKDEPIYTEVETDEPDVFVTSQTHQTFVKNTITDENGDENIEWVKQGKATGNPKVGRTTGLTTLDKIIITRRWKTKKIKKETWAAIKTCKVHWAAGRSTRQIGVIMSELNQNYINLACACFSEALETEAGRGGNRKEPHKTASVFKFMQVLLGFQRA